MRRSHGSGVSRPIKACRSEKITRDGLQPGSDVFDGLKKNSARLLVPTEKVI